MRRREFITLASSAAIAWPLAARAQQAALPVIGFLGAASHHHYAHLIDVYRRGLTEAGYDDGRNVTIDFRWAKSQCDRLPGLAPDLARCRVSVMTAGSFPAALAAKAASAAGNE